MKQLHFEAFNTVDTLILCGGLGTRLKTVLPHTQKTLAPIAGKPFLEYLVRQLKEAGLRKVILCVGAFAEQVQSHFKNEFEGIEIGYSIETEPLGTAGAVRLALNQIKSSNVLILNGDSFCGVNLENFYNDFCEDSCEASIVATQVLDVSRYGQIELTQDGTIGSFVEKGTCRGPGYINAGIYLFTYERLRSIPLGVPLSLERDVFPTIAKQGVSYFKSESNQFIDIGTPESLRSAEAFFSSLAPVSGVPI